MESKNRDIISKLKIKLNNKDLIIVSLLEYICDTFHKPLSIQNNIFTYLLENKIINDKNVLLPEYSHIRHMCTQLLETLINGDNEVMDFSKTITSKKLVSKKIVSKNQIIPYNSRYKTDFIELELLGKGGFGSVYKVYNKLDQQTYAIKKLKIKKISDFDNSYINEVIYMSKLAHPNIVRYYGTWMELPTLYIQMELCSNVLEDYIMKRNCGKIDSGAEMSIFKQIVSGIEYIHSNNIIHGDLNPNNIFLIDDNVKIGDFGLSKVVGEEEKNLSSYGNQLYMSYEQKELRICVLQSDIYSLGLIFFMLFFRVTTIMEQIMIFSKLQNLENIGDLDEILKQEPVSELDINYKNLLFDLCRKNYNERISARDILMTF